MNSIKEILKEELLLNSRKNLLSEQSLLLINNHSHINHVLGIKTPINEIYSLELRKQIIEEQLMLEDLLGSISKFVGSAVEKGKEKVISVVDSVHNIKDIALLFKDLILSPEYMARATTVMGKTCNGIANRLKNKLVTIGTKIGNAAGDLLDKFNELIQKAIDLLIKLSSGTGWKGFLTMLGFSILMTLLETKIIDMIINQGVNILDKFTGIIDGATIMLNGFKEFATSIISSLDITPIISWMTDNVLNTVLGGFFSGVNMINVIGLILIPVIKAIDWSKKLVKK
jgi:hypothetical protein